MPIYNNKFKNNGFTLVELSIVIVIIGLIVAGVVGGQTLVQQAKLRNVIADLNKWQVAINAFRLEYNALPGDFDNAAAYTLGTSGNGNRKIYSAPNEGVDAWDHLANAGLIANSSYFTGNPGKPLTPLGENTRYTFTYAGTDSTGGGGNHMNLAANLLYQKYTGNLIQIGGGGGAYMAGVLTVNHARSIDSKMDDGIPDAGILYAGGGNGSQCVDTWIRNAGPISYLADNGQKVCRLLYLLK